MRPLPQKHIQLKVERTAMQTFFVKPQRFESRVARSNQRGATLVEALIAMVILAVGLLGMAGMTAASVKHNQTARMRGIGVLLVNDLAERARINLKGFDIYKKNAKYSFSDKPKLPTGCDAKTSCTPTELATYDLQEWLYNVNRRLPGGSAYISTTTTGTKTETVRDMDIWLIWTEATDKGSKAASTTDASVDNMSQACPAEALPQGDTKGVRCMYFRVTL